MNEKPKILFFNYDLTVVGGVARVVCNLAWELQDACALHLVSMTGVNPAFPFPLPPDVSFAVLMPGRHRIRETLLAGRLALRRYCREHRIEAVFVLGSWAGFAAYPAVRRLGLPLVWCDHGTLSIPNPTWKERAELRMECRGSVRLVTLTRGAAGTLARRCPAAAGKITVIPNAVPLPEAAAPFHQAPREIVSLIRLMDDKGLPELLETASLLKARRPDFIWRIWGEGSEREQAAAGIARRGLEQNVLLMGLTADAPAAYARAGVCALTSKREGLPLVLLEAKAMGLPCVSFDVAFGPGELIRDGVDGYLIPHGDCAAMADCLARLIADDALARSMAEAARDNLAPYRPAQVKQAWLSLIGRVTGRLEREAPL